ncbi:MAG: long-chain-fatty-acid--CoA ligase [Caulobacteraceae bacterium]|nr:long-chain-fatty-acid--CoA ligase [Caulobacteraceae bacterium]
MKELTCPRYLKQLLLHGDNISFVDYDDVEYSARTFYEQSLRLANALRSNLKLEPSEPFAVLAGNSYRYITLWAAAYFGGGVISAMNTRLHALEIRQMLQHVGCRTIFADAETIGLVREATAGFDPAPRLVRLDDVSEDGALTYAELINSGELALLEEPAEDSTVLYSFTGGTTGRSKTVMITQRSLALNFWRSHFNWGGAGRGAVYYLSSPLFHVAGSGVGALYGPISGGKVIIRKTFDPGQMLDDIERFQVTHVGLVPTMLSMLLEHPSFKSSKFAPLRRISYGAAPMPPALLRQMMAMFPHAEFGSSYGMTEAGGPVTALTPEDHDPAETKLNSVGRPMPGVALTIRLPDGAEAPVGTPGEIWLQSGGLTEGYLKDPEETKLAFSGGWFHTGDAGYVDEQGYVYLVDRLKDMIVSGGENVYSVEVERAIASHPDVSQVAVVGLPHPHWGEVVHAVVVPRPGAALTQDMIVAHSQAHIARYKCPKSVEFRSEPLPLSAVNKVLKRKLREDATHRIRVS